MYCQSETITGHCDGKDFYQVLCWLGIWAFHILVISNQEALMEAVKIETRRNLVMVRNNSVFQILDLGNTMRMQLNSAKVQNKCRTYILVRLDH